MRKKATTRRRFCLFTYILALTQTSPQLLALDCGYLSVDIVHCLPLLLPPPALSLLSLVNLIEKNNIFYRISFFFSFWHVRECLRFCALVECVCVCPCE